MAEQSGTWGKTKAVPTIVENTSTVASRKSADHADFGATTFCSAEGLMAAMGEVNGVLVR